MPPLPPEWPERGSGVPACTAEHLRGTGHWYDVDAEPETRQSANNSDITYYREPESGAVCYEPANTRFYQREAQQTPSRGGSGSSQSVNTCNPSWAQPPNGIHVKHSGEETEFIPADRLRIIPGTETLNHKHPHNEPRGFNSQPHGDGQSTTTPVATVGYPAG